MPVCIDHRNLTSQGNLTLSDKAGAKLAAATGALSAAGQQPLAGLVSMVSHENMFLMKKIGSTRSTSIWGLL